MRGKETTAYLEATNEPQVGLVHHKLDVASNGSARGDLNLGTEHAHDHAQLGVLDNRKGPVA